MTSVSEINQQIKALNAKKKKHMKIAPVAASFQKSAKNLLKAQAKIARREVEFQPQPVTTAVVATPDSKTSTEAPARREPLYPNTTVKAVLFHAPRHLMQYREAMGAIRLSGGLKEGLRVGDALRAMGVHQRPQIVMLWYDDIHTSSSTSVLNTINLIRPSLSAEFSDLAVLFDIYKAKKCKIHYHVIMSSNATATTNIQIGGGYDAADVSNTLSSFVQIFSYRWHKCTVLNPMGNGSNPNAGPAAQTQSGFWTHEFPIPQEPITDLGNSGGNTTIVTGNWVPTTITAADFGGRKIWASATAAGTSTVNSYVGVEVTFKNRE